MLLLPLRCFHVTPAVLHSVSGKFLSAMFLFQYDRGFIYHIYVTVSCHVTPVLNVALGTLHVVVGKIVVSQRPGTVFFGTVWMVTVSHKRA